MDNHLIKTLLLEKLFYEFVPKLIDYYQLLYESKSFDEFDYTWSPSLNCLPDSQKFFEQQINLSVLKNTKKNTELINFNIILNYAEVQRAAQRARLLRLNIPNENLDIPPLIENKFIFTDKKNAIKKISNSLNLLDIIKITKAAENEISNFENPDNFSIGTIKKLLGINSEIDLTNISIRKTLIEKI